jgi:hypothetical protein
MGSGIATLLFFQGLCETSIHSAWANSTFKKKAPLFACTVCPCWLAGSVAGILGYLMKLWCYFLCCFYKGQLAMAICLSQKYSAICQLKTLFHCCFYKGQLAIAICLGQQITSTVFSLYCLPCLIYKGGTWNCTFVHFFTAEWCFYMGQPLHYGYVLAKN